MCELILEDEKISMRKQIHLYFTKELPLAKIPWLFAKFVNTQIITFVSVVFHGFIAVAFDVRAGRITTSDIGHVAVSLSYSAIVALGIVLLVLLIKLFSWLIRLICMLVDYKNQRLVFSDFWHLYTLGNGCAVINGASREADGELRCDLSTYKLKKKYRTGQEG